MSIKFSQITDYKSDLSTADSYGTTIYTFVYFPYKAS